MCAFFVTLTLFTRTRFSFRRLLLEFHFVALALLLSLILFLSLSFLFSLIFCLAFWSPHFHNTFPFVWKVHLFCLFTSCKFGLLKQAYLRERSISKDVKWVIICCCYCFIDFQWVFMMFPLCFFFYLLFCFHSKISPSVVVQLQWTLFYCTRTLTLNFFLFYHKINCLFGRFFSSQNNIQEQYFFLFFYNL